MDDSAIIDEMTRLSDLALEHGRLMYIQALRHAIAMIEIDAKEGLKSLKEELSDAVRNSY